MALRLTVFLEPQIGEALIKYAEREERDPRRQAAYIIRQWLGQSGMIEIRFGGNPMAKEKPHGSE